MPNNIVLAKGYIDLLDEVYKSASVTADLTSDPSLIRQGANVNELIYPQIIVSGLGDYDRNSGYTNGSVNVQWKSAVFNYDRGTKISVDAMDNQETFDIAFGAVGAALQREKVAPEADAFTFATLAGTEGISIGDAVTFASAVEFLEGLLEAKNTMDEDEVPEEGRILYATPTLLNGVMALDTTKSREVLNSFAVRKKADAGKDINFMIVHKPAVLKWDKHPVSSIIHPDNNPDSDAFISKYRKYGIVDVYKNKTAGIYLSHKA